MRAEHQHALREALTEALRYWNPPDGSVVGRLHVERMAVEIVLAGLRRAGLTIAAEDGGQARRDALAAAVSQRWRVLTPDLPARTGTEVDLWHALDQLAVEHPRVGPVEDKERTA